MATTLAGKTLFITGASRGIGKAIALRAARDGANIAVIGKTEAPHPSLPGTIHSAAAEIEAAGGKALALAADVRDEEAIRAAVARAAAHFGGIDILVNNAGIQLRKPMLELATDEWRRVIEANLTGAFVVGREAARRMTARGRGKIINIGSLTSEVARATIAPYAVSKGGIKLLTRAMAAEWAAQGVQANAIGPGYMLTDMNQALIENAEFDAWVKARTPAKRWGEPGELIGAAIFLASRASDYVNGQIIYVDGGLLAVI
jgi:gluconate 5-dehydrogenase